MYLWITVKLVTSLNYQQTPPLLLHAIRTDGTPAFTPEAAGLDPQSCFLESFWGKFGIAATKLSRHSDGYGLNCLGWGFRQGQENFLFCIASLPGLGPNQPPNQWVPGALSLRLTWHSPQSNAEVDNGGTKPSIPHTTSWISAQLFKHRDYFTVVLQWLRQVSNLLCGLVVRAPGYRSRSPCSIPGATRFSEK
jgi:hypothetical protein